MSDAKEYEPDLGQAFGGNPWEKHVMPEYAEALFEAIWKEIARVFWNMNQREFDPYGTDDPKIPGFEVRSYWWGDENASEADLPNFVFGDVRIRWYKYPGRGMSANVSWDPVRWVEWFDSALAAIRAHEKLWDEERRNKAPAGFEITWPVFELPKEKVRT